MKRAKFIAVFIFAFFISISFIGITNAAIVFSSYGDGFSYNTISGLSTVYERQLGSLWVEDWDQAMQFFPAGQDYLLDSIYVTAGKLFGSNEMDVWLMSDSNNNPGAIMESFHLSNLLPVHTGRAQSPILIDSISRPTLLSDTAYWLALSVTKPGSQSIWYRNNIGQVGTWAVWNNNNWNTYENAPLGVFQVNGSAVPIPGAAWLLGAGLLGLVALKRKRTRLHAG